MKKFKTTLIIAIFLLQTLSMAALAQKEEKWQKNMQKDYQKVLKAKTQKPERHRGLVQKWQDEGHLNDLIKLYESDLPANETDPYFHYGLGFAYALKGDEDSIKQALYHFNEAVKIDARMIYAHFSIGGIHLKEERYKQAKDKFDKCLAIDPKFYVAQYNLGEVYREQGEYQPALQEYQAVLKIKPKWYRPYYGIGLVHFAEGNYDTASMDFQQALKFNAKFAPAYYKLGQVYAKQRQPAEAMSQYKNGNKHRPYNAEELYELGIILAEEDNSVYAKQVYEKAIQIDPKHAPTYLQLGEIYYREDLKDKAIEHYKRAVELDPELKNYFIDQLEQYQAGLLGVTEAKVLLDKSLAINPNDAVAHFNYAKIEEDSGDTDAAISHYESAIQNDPQYLDTYMPLGDLYYDKGYPEKATSMYRQAIELKPDLEKYFFEQGEWHLKNKMFDGAVKNFEKYIMLYQQDAEARYLLGRSFAEMGNPDKALRQYEDAIKINPQHKDALYQSAMIYRQKKAPEKALNVLVKLISIAPDNVDAHYMMALSHLELNHSDEARQSFQKTTELNPEHIEAHFQLGMLHSARGEIEAAINEYETTIKLEPDRATPYFRVGAIYLNRANQSEDAKQSAKEKDNVIRVYEKGLHLKPNHPQEQYDLALIFEERNEAEKAIKHYGLANKFSPENLKWHFRYARLLDRHAAFLSEKEAKEPDDEKEIAERREKYAGMAVDEYSRTIQLNLNYAPAYYYRGLIVRRYRVIGSKQYSSSQIAEDFKQVTQIDPKNADAHYHLAMTLLDWDKQLEARNVFEKVLKLNPKYEDANLQLGLIAEWKRELDKAIKHYEAEIRLDDNATRAHQQLAFLYSDYKHDFDKAQIEYKKALAQQPNHVSTLINYGRMLYQLDKLGAAAEQFEKVIQINPENPTANFNLALMYEYSGRTKLAIAQWKRALKLNLPETWAPQARQHLRQLEK